MNISRELVCKINNLPECYSVKNILSPGECSHWWYRLGWSKEALNKDERYRKFNQTRYTCTSSEFVELIRSRLHDHIDKEIILDGKKYVFENIGPTFTTIRYKDEGLLHPHFDRHRDCEPGTIFMSLIIYLNDEYKSGHTWLTPWLRRDSKIVYEDCEKYNMSYQAPKDMGSAFLFFGNRIAHCGSLVHGTKKIVVLVLIYREVC